jgi:hypothetical protein
MTKVAKKKSTTTKKKKLTLDKDTVRKLTDEEVGGVAGGRMNLQTHNMKCNSDPTACKCG